MTDKTVMLLDGNSLMNRAYYGLAGRQNLNAADGTPTGAVYAFLNMFLRYRDLIQPDLIFALFDRPEPTFRHEVYSEYKGDRKKMPDELAMQMPLVKELLDALGVKRYEAPGYEADDLIGTLAHKAVAQGYEVTIVSGDRDTFQLINENTDVLMPVSRQGLTQQEVINLEVLADRYGLIPEQIVDLKALMGDSSDGIPGIKGVGEKTALKLLHEYGNLETVLANSDQIKGVLGERIRAEEDMARLSYDLAKIERAVPIPDLPEDLKCISSEQSDSELLQFFLRLGFKSMIPRFGLEQALADWSAKLRQDSSITARERFKCSDQEEFLQCSKDQEIVIAWEEHNDHVVGLISSEGCVIYLPGADAVNFLSELSDRELTIWDYKSFLRQFQQKSYKKPPFDLKIAAYLLDQMEGQIQLETVLSRSLASDYQPYPSLTHTTDAQISLLEGVEHRAVLTETEQSRIFYRAQQMIAARNRQEKMAADLKLERLLAMEFTLAGVLADMEAKGITLDQAELKSQTDRMAADISVLEDEIYALAGHEFNLNSPKQLSIVLFEELGLPPGRKTKTGQYSTAADELEALKFSHQIIPLILEHRSLSKLKSTFLDGLSLAVDADGRVRTSYHQTLTSTGRLSSSNPNLQNIPIRTKRGREIRNIFVAAPGYILLDADYAQIELRLLAHLSQDSNLLQAFADNIDVHKATASSLFSVPVTEVNSEQRDIAKTVNFSIVYGISDFGLARDLGISIGKAHDYIAAYDARYQKVREWLNNTIKLAYDRGYVETLLGRRRYITELKSSDTNVRNFGERAAANAPVQGTAADLIKIAMVRIHDAFIENNLDAHLVLQVHDELLVEASLQDAEAAAKILHDNMVEAMSLSVPLVAEVASGQSWGEVKA
ncbi:MAG: DNA polymerase I [Clostridiaceae bacterium]|nr:DNA polymerase I [Clostridiaceae bacterium]